MLICFIYFILLILDTLKFRDIHFFSKYNIFDIIFYIKLSFRREKNIS